MDFKNLKLAGDVMSDQTIMGGYNRGNQVAFKTPQGTIYKNLKDIKLTTKPKPVPWECRTDLIMLGTGPTTDQCKFDCETWTMNDGFQSLDPKRLDKLFFFEKEYFQLAFPWGKHSTRTVADLRSRGVEITPQVAQQFGIKYRFITPQILDQLNIPIISPWVIPSIKKFEPYPLWDIVNTYNSEFFTNSFAYMIAYALYQERFKKIKLYGVDMSNEHELYRNERGGVEYWIGYAQGKGLEVEVSKGSSVRQRKLYGIQD